MQSNFFFGIDLSYKLGFAENFGNKTSKSVNINALDDYTDRILKDLKIINFSAKNINVQIFNLNNKSLYDIIPIVEL